MVTTDRGTHNRGIFGRTLADNSVYVRPIGLESPEQLGRGERHGDMLKWNLKRIIRSHNVTGKEHMKLALAESLAAKNEYLRRGGFSPSQWVLGRSPRGSGHVIMDDEEIGHLGAIEGQLDGETEFALKSKYRLTARKGYVKQDCSMRAQKAMLRRAAPVPGNYAAGDLVCFRREQRKKDSRVATTQRNQEPVSYTHLTLPTKA